MHFLWNMNGIYIYTMGYTYIYIQFAFFNSSGFLMVFFLPLMMIITMMMITMMMITMMMMMIRIAMF